MTDERPAEGYCRGRLARENFFRVLRGQKPFDYPESKYVGRETKEKREAANRAKRLRRAGL